FLLGTRVVRPVLAKSGRTGRGIGRCRRKAVERYEQSSSEHGRKCRSHLLSLLWKKARARARSATANELDQNALRLRLIVVTPTGGHATTGSAGISIATRRRHPRCHIAVVPKLASVSAARLRGCRGAIAGVRLNCRRGTTADDQQRTKAVNHESD